MMNVTRILIALSCASILASCSSSPQAESGPMVVPAVPVSVGKAVEESVPIQATAVGTVEPYSSVGVKAQIGGQLLSVNFAQGANVTKGDLLFEIDPRSFREALRQAETAILKDEAELRVAEANLSRERARLKNAEADLARYEQLSKEGISTRMQEDQIRTAAEIAVQSVRAVEASLESIKAAIETDRSAVEQAKLNLSYSEIRAPISGRTGNLLLNAGNLVQANSENPLVVINQVSPVFVKFGVPERYLPSIARQNSRGRLTVEVTPGEGSGEVVRGKLAVIDNSVDSATGTISLKADFDNRGRQLWPGQFVNVVLTIDKQTATVIPSEAIQSGQQGPFVYVVKEDETVEARPVMVGQTIGGKAVVQSGITAGETVVTDGQSRLYPAAKVTIAVTPESSSAK